MLTIATGPTVEPISTEEAKNHLRVDIEDDNAVIKSLILAARESVEVITRRALITQTWDYYLDEFPGESRIFEIAPGQWSFVARDQLDQMLDGGEALFESGSDVYFSVCE